MKDCWIKSLSVQSAALLTLLSVGCSDQKKMDEQWTLLDHDTTLSLSSYQGQWVVVNYWATWCGPCREEMPLLEQFHRTYNPQGKAAVIGVNYEPRGTAKPGIEQFISQYKISFPIVWAKRLTGESVFGNIRGLPSTFIINPKGELAFSHAGLLTKQQMAEVTGLTLD